jgi:hypothetical protein
MVCALQSGLGAENRHPILLWAALGRLIDYLYTNIWTILLWKIRLRCVHDARAENLDAEIHLRITFAEPTGLQNTEARMIRATA